MTRATVRRVALGCVLSAAIVFPATGQEMPVPIEVQADLLGRILQFDRDFAARAGDEIVVAVLYQSRFRASLTAREDIARLLEDMDGIAGRPLRVVAMELDPSTSLEAALERSEADVVYVSPLRATGVGSIVQATRRLRILSYTGVPEYVDDGVSVGFSIRGAGSEILINLDAAIAEGARFSSELLKLSRVIETREDQR